MCYNSIHGRNIEEIMINKFVFEASTRFLLIGES